MLTHEAPPRATLSACSCQCRGHKKPRWALSTQGTTREATRLATYAPNLPHRPTLHSLLAFLFLSSCPHPYPTGACFFMSLHYAVFNSPIARKSRPIDATCCPPRPCIVLFNSPTALYLNPLSFPNRGVLLHVDVLRGLQLATGRAGGR